MTNHQHDPMAVLQKAVNDHDHNLLRNWIDEAPEGFARLGLGCPTVAASVVIGYIREFLDATSLDEDTVCPATDWTSGAPAGAVRFALEVPNEHAMPLVVALNRLSNDPRFRVVPVDSDQMPAPDPKPKRCRKDAGRCRRRSQLLKLQTQTVALLTEDLQEMRDNRTADHARFDAECRRLGGLIDHARGHADELAASLGHQMQLVTDHKTLLVERTTKLAEVEAQLAAAREELARVWPLPAPVQVDRAELGTAGTFERDGKLVGYHDGIECDGPASCPNPDAHPVLTQRWEVPKCAQNRIDRATLKTPVSLDPTPATYCESAYCDRCAAYRRMNGVPVLEPNGWMKDLTPGEAAALPETQGAFAALGIDPSGLQDPAVELAFPSSGPPPGDEG